MSTKDIRQGRDYSTGNLAAELRKTAMYHGPREYAIMHAAADQLEELEKRARGHEAAMREMEEKGREIVKALENYSHATLDDYDQKRHSGLLEE